jgi:thioredoxin reductase (NADPH)
MSESIHKCIIIGSGPAGYTAAVYAARANMHPILFTGPEPGGQLITTTDVENFPGYPKGIGGPEMMEEFRAQAERFGTDIRYELISEVNFKTGEKYHLLRTDGGAALKAYTVIIATGASAKYLGLPSEKHFLNNGVSACAVCDGFFFRGKEVAVVGGGDTAAEEATYLAKLCPRVHLIVRRDQLRASRIMQERVFSTENITVHWNTETEEIIGDAKVTGVRVVNNKTGERQVLPVEGFFVAIGHQPNTAIFKDFINMDETGYLLTVAGSSRTNIPGVFASGDAQDKVYRQAVTAAGTGCMAALDAERYLVSEGLS